jgi:hypothetical protein
VETILYWCDGLPIALAISGRTIGESARRQGQTPSGAIHSFVRRLQRDPSRLIDKPGDDYPALATVLGASLEMASKHNPVNEASGNHSLEKMYAALCVMQKQGWAPVSMLKRLWGLEDVVDAEDIVELLWRYSLASEEIRNSQKWIKLHDLALDHCSSVAGQDDGVAFWHRKLLDGYCQKVSREWCGPKHR